MSTSIFVNLPVEDLAASRAFYAALGYTLDENFSNDVSTTVVISDTIYVMLLARPTFQSSLTTEVADATKVTEATLGLSAASREEVDHLALQAFAAGASFARETEDLGFMYTRSFRDPDGHFWEVFWMDPQAAQGTPPAS
ncbi:VOC family protein [Jiangella alkaliphila]|uniref:VOC domain-containing protein n=1 Tax=Jiangella alkaliphila TaxID=419479 RepID=A0A1H2KYD3_9ACTN|nr:VOC family protein [Jiangella alkaliphila]SDU73787.1 hypothetical protein SAMN04488563_4608 [Jiangella alkaliphila]